MKRALAESLVSVQTLADTLDDATRSPWLVSPLTDRMRPPAQRARRRPARRRGRASRPSTTPTACWAPTRPGATSCCSRRRSRPGAAPASPATTPSWWSTTASCRCPGSAGSASSSRAGRPRAAAPDRRSRPSTSPATAGSTRSSTWRNVTDVARLPQRGPGRRSSSTPSRAARAIDGVLSVDPAGLAALLRYTGAGAGRGHARAARPPTTRRVPPARPVRRVPRRQPSASTCSRTVARTTFERLTSADLPSPRAWSSRSTPSSTAATSSSRPSRRTRSCASTSSASPAGSRVRRRHAGGRRPATPAATRSTCSSSALALRRPLGPGDQQVEGTITLPLSNKAPRQRPARLRDRQPRRPAAGHQPVVRVGVHAAVAGRRPASTAQPAALEPSVELERNVYSTFVDIPPGGTVDSSSWT